MHVKKEPAKLQQNFVELLAHCKCFGPRKTAHATAKCLKGTLGSSNRSALSMPALPSQLVLSIMPGHGRPPESTCRAHAWTGRMCCTGVYIEWLDEDARGRSN